MPTSADAKSTLPCVQSTYLRICYWKDPTSSMTRKNPLNPTFCWAEVPKAGCCSGPSLPNTWMFCGLHWSVGESPQNCSYQFLQIWNIIASFSQWSSIVKLRNGDYLVCLCLPFWSLIHISWANALVYESDTSIAKDKWVYLCEKRG